MAMSVPANPGYAAGCAVRLPVERFWLYRPETEWMYSHHASLVHFNGYLHAIWSNGRRDEDAPGQRVLTASSEDGTRWSVPRPLLDVQQGRWGERVLTAAGFHQDRGLLVAYVGDYEYEPEALKGGCRRPDGSGHVGTNLLALTTRDGLSWSAPRNLKLPVVPNHGPQRTASGRLIISGNISFPWTDDPSGLAGWRMTGIYPDSMSADVVDDSESFWRVKEKAGWPAGLCEGSFYQVPDGTLRMLLRSSEDLLWLTESHDDGMTWSAPRPTSFTDNATKFHFGRLPDGRYYYVGCPDPEPRWQRTRLVLSLSEDGSQFDRHFLLADSPYARRAEGMHKHGEYGYPHTLLHDGWLYVIVSRQKEAVEVLRVSLSAIGAG